MLIVIKKANDTQYHVIQYMQQRIKQEKANQHNLNIFSYTEETIHLFGQIMSNDYAANLKSENLEDDLARFFNGLIWAEKKNPLLVYQMFEMKSCHQIVEKYIDLNPVVLLRNSILLLGNCESGGLVAEQLVDHQYPHCLLNQILKPGVLLKFKEEIGEYIGNFLKCYHKLFKIEWLGKFILPDGYFQLLEINLKYYNCPDFMARTNALNIVLDLLRRQEVRQFISSCEQRRTFYITVFERMSKLFRNELTEFGLRISHISKEDSVDYIFAELEDKIALWVDISSNFKGLEQIIQLPFCNEVLLPLVIGPLEVNQKPLFTLKYALFVIKKLLPVMKQFRVLDIYVRIIFTEDQVFYYPNSLRKAFIQPFSLQKLLTKQISLDQPEQKDGRFKIKDFYKNIFQSKDNHFILMTNSLLSALFAEAQACTQLSSLYGFDYNGELSIKVCRILLAQLKDTHQLHTIESILDCLICIKNGRSLETELQNQYIYIFQHLILQLKNGLNLSKSNIANENIKTLAETIQYDLAIVNKLEFKKDKDFSKYENIFKVVFEWEIRKEEMKNRQFYARVPDSPAEYLRYLFIKFMYLKKARTVLLDHVPETNEYEHYHELMLTRCPYIPEDLYNPAQIPQILHICQLLSEKQKVIAEAYLIKDNNFFILGLPKSQRVLITHGVNLKHVGIEEARKKKVKVRIRKFDSETLEMVEVETLWIRIDSSLCEHMAKRCQAVVSKNIEFARVCLQKTESEQPNPSLI